MSYNFNALSMNITPEMVQAYQTSSGKTGTVKTVNGFVHTLYGLAVIFGLIFIVMAIPQLVNQRYGEAIQNFLVYAIIIGTVLIIAELTRNIFELRWKRMTMINQFALDNNFTYEYKPEAPQQAGMLFDLGHSRTTTDQLSGTAGGVPFVSANYSYTVGSGKHSQTFTYGYIHIRLQRALPHIVLDSIKNNTKFFGMETSNLPAQFDKKQTMRLEGNFNEFFRLYAPIGYEQDALYIFTPDLMALFMDVVAGYDAEIVDDQLFIYSPVTIQYQDQTFMENMFKIIETIGDKTIGRTDRYMDHRAEIVDGGVIMVADEGRRLKKRAYASWIIAAIVILYFTANIILNVLSH